MKKYILLVFTIFFILKYSCQGINNFSYNYAFPNTTVPEKASLLKFEQFPNIEALGGTNINIPIYTLQLDGMEIPIALAYNTKGIKVADISSNIGLGWNFIGDGSIEYQINDLYDFTLQDMEVSGGYDSGPGPFYERAMTGKLIPDNYYMIGVNMHHRDDVSPDFYHVSAPNFRNSFYLKKDLSVCPNDDCGYATNQFTPVFFEQDNIIANQPIKRINATPSNFIVFNGEDSAYFNDFSFINSNGFTYKFSNPTNIITSNYNHGFLDYIISDGTSQNYSNWKLTGIQSPYSSNSVSYTYEDYVNSYNHPQLIRNNDTFGYGLSIGGLSPSLGGYFNTRSTTHYYNTKRLKKISTADTEVIFSYDDTRKDYPGGMLSMIQVTAKNSGKVIKTVTLNHSYFLPKDTSCTNNYDCLRLRLDGVTDSSSGTYSFNYDGGNSDYKFPKRSSSKIDFAGYYNANTSDIVMYPDGDNEYIATSKFYYPMGKVFHYPNLANDNYIPFQLSNYTPESTTGTIDLSSNINSLVGLLTDVTYPTGGGMNIKYENDQFNYLGANYLLGSARIKEMNLFDKTGILKKIEYDYKNADGTSSGQIAGFTPPSSNGSHALVVGLELNNSNTVIYSKVTEKTSGKGKTEYYYSNYDKYPNNYGVINGLDCSICDGWKTEIKELKYPYMNIYKPDSRRAQLEKKSVFDEAGNKLEETEISYEFNETNGVQITVPFNKMGSFDYMGTRSNTVMQIHSNNKKKEIISQYPNNKLISQEINYTYDLNRNLLKTISNDWQGTTLYKELSYASDKNNSILLNANIKNIPLEVKESKTQNGVNKLISDKEVSYMTNANGKVNQSSVISHTINGNNVVDITYDKYDDKGNILQYTDKGLKPVAFIWGYNQTRPIAKIEGAKYDDVKNLQVIIDAVTASNNDDIQNTGTSEQNLITALDNVRTNSNLSNYFISVYSYDPLIGITTITPSNGIRETYKYDSSNRLQSVVDVNGNILKENKYNYATPYYNTIRSQNFTRNNCGIGFTGGSYTYTVPAAKYSSMISQADADAKAQTDISTNGQNMANTYGTCTSQQNICTISPSDTLTSVTSNFLETTPNHFAANVTITFNEYTVTTLTVGTLGSSCRPNTTKTFSKNVGGKIWTLTIYNSGQVTIQRSPSKINIGESIDFSFEYDK